VTMTASKSIAGRKATATAAEAMTTGAAPLTVSVWTSPGEGIGTAAVRGILVARVLGYCQGSRYCASSHPNAILPA
jgi:hypothetical protein